MARESDPVQHPAGKGAEGEVREHAPDGNNIRVTRVEPDEDDQCPQKRGLFIISCSPSQATEESMLYQHPLIRTFDCFPGDNKMAQQHMNRKVLDFITPRLFDGRVTSQLCYSKADDEPGDRITAGSLFPCLRLFVPKDVELQTHCIPEDARRGVVVLECDEKGEPVCDSDGVVKLVSREFSPPKSDLYEEHDKEGDLHEEHEGNTKGPQAVDFVTYVLVKDREERVKEKKPYFATKNLRVPASIYEHKKDLSRKAVFQTGMAGCRLLLSHLEDDKLVDRLECFVGAMRSFNHSIIDPFGFVRVTNHLIDDESYKDYESSRAFYQEILGDSYPRESWSRFNCPDKESLQKLYNERRTGFKKMYKVDFPSTTTSYLVGVFYSMPLKAEALPTGQPGMAIETVWKFVQGLMRIHVGNSFLSWSLEQVKSTYKHRSAEALEKLRVDFEDGELFCCTREITFEQLKANPISGIWDLAESPNGYVLRLKLKSWEGEISVKEYNKLFGGVEEKEVGLKVTHQHQKFAVFFMFPEQADPNKYEVWKGTEEVSILFFKRKRGSESKTYLPKHIETSTNDRVADIGDLLSMAESRI